MRVKPNVAMAVGVWIAYLATIVVFWTVNDVDFETVTDSVDNVISAIVIPIGVGGLIALIAAVLTGWLRPVFFEERRFGPAWVWIVPILFAASAIITTLVSDLGSIDSELLLWLAVAVVLIGFGEEIVNRGILVVGFRARFGEVGVWLASSILFGILHGANFLFGLEAGDTLYQIGFAFAGGTALYVARMISGGLILPIILHAMWDFSTFTAGITETQSIGAPIGILSMILAFVAVRGITRDKDTSGPGQ